MSFAKGNFDCICFFGYHTMEGTLGGVLSHTMNSKVVQYYKLNGKYIGEIDMDSYIAASHGMPSVFFAGGDITCKQAKKSVDTLVTVVTKTELERNKAVFRNNDELLDEIKRKIVCAVSSEAQPKTLDFPSVMEKSFKRVEDAAKYLLALKERGICAEYLSDEILGKDAHTVVSTVSDMDEFIKCI
jgi:D-aminopeptidase